MLAKSILGLSDYLNAGGNHGQSSRIYSNQFLKNNLEAAMHSMIRANDLSPNDPALKHDLSYVTNLYHSNQARLNQIDDSTTNMLKPEDSTMVD